MRKCQGLCAVAAAVCVLFTACGKNQEEVEPTLIPEQGGTATPTGTTVIPDIPDMPDQNIPEMDGVTVIEIEDEELANSTVIKDEHSGYLMYQGLFYEILDEETVRVPDYYDLEITKLVIPDTITYEGKTYRVTRVGEDAFSYFYGLEQVTLGNNVEVLEGNAFMGCSDLTEVVFGTGLKEIGAHAFEACDILEAIALPEGLESVGEEAFCSCAALAKITLPSTLSVLGNNMFFDCEALKEVKIPASVETIPFGLFTNCTLLEKVELVEGLLVIEQESFWACESLKSLVLPDSLVFIGDRTFYNSGLESITFPDKRVSLGEGIFDFCENLTTVHVSAQTQEYYEGILGDELEYKVLQ